MDRIRLTDGSGRYFDAAKAEQFDEDTYWNGNNYISKATGSQWDHQALYRTAGGRWILEHRSQWQGSRDMYEEISDAEAAAWLSINGHEAHPACATEYAALEIA